MRFIGDIHGKYAEYEIVAYDSPSGESIQVGDFGIGFGRPPYGDIVMPPEHKFIRGNHDNPGECKKHPNWIPDGTYDEEKKILYIGGALSIDKAYRTPGISWWPDEELSYSEMMVIFDDIMNKNYKPKIIVSHDAPEVIVEALFPFYEKGRFSSTTRVFLQNIFENVKPDMWFFGHWHQSKRRNVLGTEFICLAELEHLDIEME
jgi:predicted phosphohydrolase